MGVFDWATRVRRAVPLSAGFLAFFVFLYLFLVLFASGSGRTALLNPGAFAWVFHISLGVRGLPLLVFFLGAVLFIGADPRLTRRGQFFVGFGAGALYLVFALSDPLGWFLSGEPHQHIEPIARLILAFLLGAFESRWLTP